MARKLQIPIATCEQTRMTSPEGEFFSRCHGNTRNLPKGRGRPKGPTTIADELIEETTKQYLELYDIALTTAIQYAVDSLFRYIEIEQAITYDWELSSEREARKLLMDRMLRELQSDHDIERTKRGLARRIERKNAGWECLDKWIPNLPAPTINPMSLTTANGKMAPSEIHKDHPVVRRNYKRMKP